ncbi:hypothetical protein FOC1_g10008759 [Fusarium oxysporum f. sp. cubense race 1]|uniref:Uncharacterized protein n=1 Tax=Fusarium oxysporum f. sp. cubense (strain race 1) TaxID=1229664 RepID=N4UWY3_FUSC1|nr:hypothetical protein FOC1_g10008759 [Fusarium oxysporum f. sp. cubense race 1]
MATNAPTVMPRINISYSIFVQFLSKINKGIFRDASIDALGKNEIDELLGDLRSVRGFLFDMEHRFYSGQENERNMLKPLEEVTASLERQLDCIQLAINKLNPYRGPKDI